MTDTWESMAGALRAVPDLRGAQCVGRWELFDADQDDPEDRAWAIERAIEICESCPALSACAAYVDGLKPSQRPPGVVAGRISKEPRSRRAARMSAKPRPRTHCQGCRRQTRRVTRLCERCETGSAPDVVREGPGIRIRGIGYLDSSAALALAHKIADLLTPGSGEQ